MTKEYILKLVRLGFPREQAEKIAEDCEMNTLPEKEFFAMAAALENDRVEPMKNLVEKYGWGELFERFENSVNHR